MAYNLSASSFTSFSHNPNLFCNSLSPSQLFPLSLIPKERDNFRIIFRPRKPPSHIANVSLQELEHTAVSEDARNPDQKTNSSSKSHIWVNPKSPRASKLRQKSNGFRYSSLLKIAESLDSCSAVEEDIVYVLESFGSKMVEQHAVTLLNNMSNPQTAILVLRYFQENLDFSEVILYNVTLKVFKKCRDFYGAEKLFDQMLESGVKPDKVTFLTIISCARLCNLPDKAVALFERMPSFGCEPNEGTYSLMIDVYGKVGNVDMALSLYDRARSEKWRLDVVTFIALIKIYGTSGNFDGCLNVYEEMKALGVKPNLSLYNTLMDAMGRAKRPWEAKNIYKEMVDDKIVPSQGTYASLLRAYCRARYGEDALNVYREMKEKGIKMSVVLYNTLLWMCADLGYIDDAMEIFKDMKSSGTYIPERLTFFAMISIYSCSGKVEEAEATMNEMLEAGFQPDIFIATSLIQCYGKAGRIDDIIRTFNKVLELGITPDELFCCCLLNVTTLAPKEELAKLIGCIEKANPKLGHVVKLLADKDSVDKDILKQVFELFHYVGTNVRQAYCNGLIDLCVNLNQLRRASLLFNLGVTCGIYSDTQSRSSTQWSLHLKGLSPGAALTALSIWLIELQKGLENGEELPSLLGINTGHGKHAYTEKGLVGIFKSYLEELNAPFFESPDKVGWFLTTKLAATSWLESTRFQEEVAARWSYEPGTSSILLDISS